MTEFKPIPLTETQMAELFRLRQRVAELEKQLESAYKTVDANWVSHQQLVKLTSERDALKQQRDELLAAAEAIEIDAEECLDFDECTAMLVPIDTYHKLMEAIASVKEKPSVQD